MDEKEGQKYSYLGDAVYAYFDGYGIWLRTGHHEEAKCDDKIYLEPDVLRSLNLFDTRVRKLKEEASERLESDDE